MVGILVHGNNYFILSGPLPVEAAALALVRHWSIVQIGEAESSSFGRWQIRPKEFRGNLEWAVIVPGDCETPRQRARSCASCELDFNLHLHFIQIVWVSLGETKGSYGP
jgi:hypothetical protein